MQIGIGSVYDTLPRWRSAGGHSVAVENLKGAEDVRPLADEIGATAVDANGDLAEADPIIRSIPRPAPANLPQDRFDMIVHDVSVVDAMGFDACTRTKSWRRQPRPRTIAAAIAPTPMSKALDQAKCSTCAITSPIMASASATNPQTWSNKKRRTDRKSQVRISK